MAVNNHLIPIVSGWGFKRLPEISNGYDAVSVYESSNTMRSCIWVTIVEDNVSAIELSLTEAAQLRDQLDYMIEHHYHQHTRTP